MDVIIVGREREDFSAVVLSCLLNQRCSYANNALRIFFVRHEDIVKDVYVLEQMKKLCKVSKNVELIELQYPTSVSLAYCRADVIKRYVKDEVVWMLDSDMWFAYDTLDKLCETWTTLDLGLESIKPIKSILSVTMACPDVCNERGYDDYDLNVYHSVKEFCEIHEPIHLNFHLMHRDVEVGYSCTNGIWNTKALEECGILDLWLKYPPGKRRYDGTGGLQGILNGYSCYMVGALDTKNLVGYNAIWNMWTKVAEDAFDVDTDTPFNIPDELKERIKNQELL